MSGKRARFLRKHIFSKKSLAVCAGLCLSCAPVASESEVLVSIFPHFTKPFGEAHSIEYGLGAGLKLTYRPIKYLNLFAEGDYLSMALPGVEPISIINGSIGTGYHLAVSDRISFDLNINVGAYNAIARKSMSGISAGGSLVFSYRISPVLSLDTTASATHFAAGSSPLMMINPSLSPGLSFNITELFNNNTKIDMETEEIAPVFPVLYSWYENNSFGKVRITNNEENSITDVTVSFFQPQYMAHSKECIKIKKLKRGESVDVDLYAFFNEQMLDLREKTNTNSIVIVDYSCIGQKRTKSFALTVPVYGRNNMSWDDDRRAAVFVSSKDPAAMRFAKYVISLVRENLRYDVPINIQYSLGIFEALNQFGLNYVVDPASAFEDNVGTSSIDFLQFPYQTLMYRGGDCDDISILVCSLFEAVGIDTAFITIPGHIYMAFDSGLTEAQAMRTLKSMRNYIVDEDSRVWVPLEITLSDEGFYKAFRVGAREWNGAVRQEQAALYKMNDSWKLYQPISIPGATSYFNLPEMELVENAFNEAIEVWCKGELRNFTESILAKDVIEVEPETETIVKENPLSEEATKDIVAFAYKSLAFIPQSIREEELEDYGNDDDDDELLDDLLPLEPDFQIELAFAKIDTDVPVKQKIVKPKVDESEFEFEAQTNTELEPEALSEPATETLAVYETPAEPEDLTVSVTLPEPDEQTKQIEPETMKTVALSETSYEPEVLSEPESVAQSEPMPEPETFTEPETVAHSETPAEPELQTEQHIVQEQIPELAAVSETSIVQPFTEKPVEELEPVTEDNEKSTAVSAAETTAVAAAELEPEKSTPAAGNTPAVAISVTALASTAAAGIAIFGKKKKSRRG